MEKEDFLVQVQNLLNKLTRQELVMLNREILKRVRALDDFNRIRTNAAFNPGDRVSWHDKQGNYREGYVIRINNKTITVKQPGDTVGNWRISASLLHKIP